MVETSTFFLREGITSTEHQAGLKVTVDKKSITIDEEKGIISGKPAKGHGQEYEPWFSFTEGLAGCTCSPLENGDVTYCRHIVGLFRALSKRQEKYAEQFVAVMEKNPLFASYKTQSESISTGSVAMDDMLGGGWPRGVVTLFTGPTKIGKTTTLTASAFNAAFDGLKILFVDSVVGDTPILIRKNGHIHIIPIEDLSASREDSHYNTVNDIDVWTDAGWQSIKHVYKHRVKKIMYKILTTKGFVETTEDHSFIINGKEVSPKEFKVGDSVEMIRYELAGDNKVPTDLAWVFGFFCADGSANVRERLLDSGIVSPHHAWDISNNNVDLLEKVQEILYRYGITTNICLQDGTSKLSSNYEVKKFGNSRVLTYWFNKAQSLRNRRKIVPSFILNGDVESQKAYLDGYLAGDGHLYDNGIFSFDSKDKSLLDGLCKILDRLGYEYVLYIRDDKPNIVRVHTRVLERAKKEMLPEEIRKIETYEIDDFVYDLETANHHFCGGIGSILLHNTENMIRRKQALLHAQKLFAARFKYKVEDVNKLHPNIHPLPQHNLFDVAKIFGVYIYIPKGTDRKLIPIIKKEYNKYTDIPAYKICKSLDIDMIIFDGFTELFKSGGITTSSSQNLIGRGEIINLLYESFEGIAGELDIAFVMTSHVSRDNRYFNIYEDILDKKVTERNFGVWGGSSLAYNVKYFVQLEKCTQDWAKGRDIVHVLRRLWPFMRPTHVDLEFVDDWGITDIVY